MPFQSSDNAVTLLALLVPAALGAQQPAARDSASRDTARAYTLPPLLITASVVPTSKAELGFATSIVEREEPIAYAARALTLVPGLSIDEGVGPGGPAVIHLRGGEESYTQVLFDGVPINISGGFLDIQGLTMTNVARVEVARGPLGALHGSSAMAGAVQFITREGHVGAPRVGLLVEGGRAEEHGGQARSELTVGGGSDRLRYSGGVGVTYNRGIYHLPNNLLTRDVSVRVDANPGRRWALTGTARYQGIDSHLPVRDPGATRVPLDPNQRDSRARWLGSVSAAWTPTRSWQHRLTARVLFDDFTYNCERDGVTDTTPYPFFVFDANFAFRSTLWRPGLEYVGSNQIALGRAGAQLLVSYGAEWQREAEENDQAGDFGPSHTEFHRANEAVFTEVQGRLGPRLTVLTGARLEKFEGLSAELLPRAGAVVTIVPQWVALRAATGRAFKAPNVDQQLLDNPSTIPNPDLKPESSVSWEVGATLTTPRRALTVSLGYFHQTYDDLIRTVPADTGSKQTNKNLGRTESVGVELDLERWWGRGWRTGVNAAWVRTKVLDNAGLSATDYPVGGALPAQPAVMGSAFIYGRLGSRAAGRLQGTVVGKQTVFSERFTGQRITLDPYFLLGLSAQWHALTATALYARIDNLLNTSYAVAFDRPGTPRTGALGVRVNL
jgi:vitamin B12 transporter